MRFDHRILLPLAPVLLLSVVGGCAHAPLDRVFGDGVAVAGIAEPIQFVGTGMPTDAAADDDNTDKIVAAVEKVFAAAGASLAAAATPEAFNRFVEEFVGPIEVTAAGEIRPKELPPAEAAGNVQAPYIGSIAGMSGFEAKLITR